MWSNSAYEDKSYTLSIDFESSVIIKILFLDVDKDYNGFYTTFLS